MSSGYHTLPSVVLGFHSCDKVTGLKVLEGREHLRFSQNFYDWLGNGIYFWEQNPGRALEYAEEVKEGTQYATGKIQKPFVIGAVIDLANCLNLTEPKSFGYLREAYKSLIQVYDTYDWKMPENKGAQRELDCAVIEHLHNAWDHINPFDSVRGAFPEGEPVYEGSMIQDRNHIQICLRNTDKILGYFLPLPVEKYNPHL